MQKIIVLLCIFLLNNAHANNPPETDSDNSSTEKKIAVQTVINHYLLDDDICSRVVTQNYTEILQMTSSCKTDDGKFIKYYRIKTTEPKKISITLSQTANKEITMSVLPPVYFCDGGGIFAFSENKSKSSKILSDTNTDNTNASHFSRRVKTDSSTLTFACIAPSTFVMTLTSDKMESDIKLDVEYTAPSIQ